MLCIVKKTLQIAQKMGCDVVVQLKRNQPKLYQQLQDFAVTHAAVQRHRTEDLGRRNRIEHRQTRAWDLPVGMLSEDWSMLRTLICVERKVDRFDVQHQKWQTSEEAAWYVCTRELTALQASQLVRGHWSIENSCHYVRDVTMNEDASQIRVNPGVFAQLRTWALNCLRQANDINIKAARERLAWSPELLLAMFTLA
jgi:predicted transposase YbfD/YdcC